MSLRKRQDLLKKGYEGTLRIKETERLSHRPFGSLDSKARFKLDINKVPFYNVPDLSGFQLMPYVPYKTPRPDAATKVAR